MDDVPEKAQSILDGAHCIDWRGEAIQLLAERAVFRTQHRTLIVADTHFGKAAAFRAAGVPIPSGTTATDLARLSNLLRATEAKRLVILGDFLHARSGRTPIVMDQLRAWREEWSDLTIDLVVGNHDRGAGLPPAEWKLNIHFEPLDDAPFVYTHHPLEHPHGYTLCGHVHPAYTLRDPVSRGESFRCFWFTANYAVLPSFGSFTGSKQIKPRFADLLFLIGPNKVFAIPTPPRE